MHTLAPAPVRAEKGEGHLFIRLDGIGDFWLWLPFVAALRRAYPNQPFYLVANRLWAELAEMTGLFAQVVSVNPHRLRRSFSYRRILIPELRQTLPPTEILWQTTYSRRIVAEDFLAWLLPSKEKIAWKRDPATAEPPLLSAWMDQRLYDTIFPTSALPSLHEWTRYAQWLNDLNSPSLEWEIYERIRQRIASSADGIVAILGSSVRYKLIPIPLYRELLRALHQHTGLPIRILGTAADRGYLQALELPFLEDFTGKLSLSQAVHKVASASAVVGPDTGLTHIAATLGVPTLMIAGGGQWGRFVPYPPGVSFPLTVLAQEMSCFGCGWMCRYQWSRRKPYPCISQLSSHIITQKARLWVESQVTAILK